MMISLQLSGIISMPWLKDSTGEYVQFLESNIVHKAWSLLSNEVKHIQLDDKGSIFLHQCNGYDVEKSL